MPEQESWAIQTRSIIKECFEQMRFARAAELARSRRYLEATMVLSPNGRLPIEPRELDLLARIAAQQKQFDQAGRLWEVRFSGRRTTRLTKERFSERRPPSVRVDAAR